MNLSKSLFAIVCSAFIGVANAADITIYYLPTCPHCHHAREFVESRLVYEYDNLKATNVNVMDVENRSEFFNTLKKCGYESGGVPVLVIGEKCFQGYSDSMQSELRDAIELDLSDAQKLAASENRAAMEKDYNAFISAHADRKNAVSESKKKVSNKSGNMSNVLLYVFLGLLLICMGIVIFKKQK